MANSVEELFKSSLLKHQKELSSMINIRCIIGGYIGVTFYVMMKVCGIMNEFTWKSLFFFSMPIVFNTSLMGITNWYLKKKEDEVYVNTYKYVIILVSSINYFAIAYFVPYRDAWGTIILCFFIGAYYLDYKVTLVSIVLTSGINLATFFFNTSAESLSVDIPNLLTRIQTVSFGALAALISTMLGRRMLRMCCENEFSRDLVMRNMQTVNEQVKKAVSMLSFSSEQLSELSSTQYSGAKTTATSVASILEETIQTSESVKECIELITHLANNTTIMQNQTKKAISNSEQLKETAVLGTNSIESAVESITSIKESAIKTYDSAREMDERTKKIQAIVGDIQDIVEQTSLLSLNASIEAARAGEYGKGFSVVADAIRRLSEQSKNSLKNIDTVISYMGKHETTVNELVDKVDEGVGVIRKFSEYYNEIIRNIEATISSLNTINEVVEKQEEGAQTVNDFILKVKGMSDVVSENIQETSSATQQAFASCEELLEAAKQLGKMSKELNTLVTEKV